MSKFTPVFMVMFIYSVLLYFVKQTEKISDLESTDSEYISRFDVD